MNQTPFELLLDSITEHYTLTYAGSEYALHRLHSLGYSIGLRHIHYLTMDMPANLAIYTPSLHSSTPQPLLPHPHPAPSSSQSPVQPSQDLLLDHIKFICKDVWQTTFGRSVDNLKTNHRGVFVVQDNVFRPWARMAPMTTYLNSIGASSGGGSGSGDKVRGGGGSTVTMVGSSTPSHTTTTTSTTSTTPSHAHIISTQKDVLAPSPSASSLDAVQMFKLHFGQIFCGVIKGWLEGLGWTVSVTLSDVPNLVPMAAFKIELVTMTSGTTPMMTTGAGGGASGGMRVSGSSALGAGVNVPSAIQEDQGGK